MRFKTRRSWILPLIMAILSLMVLGGSLGVRLLDLDTYKESITAGVKSALHRDLSYETGEFTFRPGPGFTFTGIRIKEKDGSSEFVRADRLTVGIALFPLLEKKVILTYMELERPVLNLIRDQNGVFNVSDLLKEETGKGARLNALRLKKGVVRFTDNAVFSTPVVTEILDTDLSMNEFVRGRDCHLSLDALLSAAGRKSPISFAGTFRVAPAKVPFTESSLNAKIRTGPVDAAHFWPYYGRYLPFRRVGGELEVDLLFRGKLNAFKSKGTFRVSRLFLDYPQVFHSVLTPRAVKGGYEIELTRRDLDIPTIKLNVDGLNVQGSCKLSDLYGKDPRITARAATTSFALKDFRQFIPYGIIIKETADFIEQKIRGGIFKLDDARLDGRVSQIAHMERGVNYRVLSALAHVEEGLLVYGPDIPPFSAIKGELQVAGKDFNLKGMSGRFGGSPFTLEGSLADFALVSPTRYPFSMAIKPRQQEAAWLLGKGRGDKLSLTDNSLLRLQGNGTTSLFTLKGDWDLTGASYLYRGALSKSAGRANTASFQGSFSKQEFVLSSLTYRLAPLEVAASARYRYGGTIATEIRTNHFAVGELAPLTPLLAKYHPGGKVQATLHGKGGSLEELAWEGEVALAGVSLKAAEKMKPLTGINGTLHFGGESVESSQLTARIGNSHLSGKGSVTGFKSPALALTFASPLFDLADLGIASKEPIRAERVQGSVTYREGSLQIASLSGQLGHSQLALKGSVQDLERPRLELQATSTHLELEDLAPLSGISGGQGGPLHLKATVAAAEGKVRDIAFKRLRASLLQEDGILYLQGVEAAVLDGDLTAKLRFDTGNPGQTRYQASFTLVKASADKVLRALGAKKQELTGVVTVSGDLTAKGETLLDFKKSALGSLKIRSERGSIRRFSVLSKIFSILNVSQLLKFHLPDMVSGGMPYKKITGDIAIRDGSASTSNLFLDSDAINISVVGKLDLVRNDLDLNIGVQPLQTVDKVVSKIPIVGWILTGHDKSLVTTYFEAKGPVEDPKVTAVPVKSLAKGVFNIFKRVFELPARLITDTGEVVIGK